MPAPRWSNGRQRHPPPLSSQVKEDESESQSQPAASALPPPTQLERPADCINRESTPNFAVLCNMMDRLRSEKANKRFDTLKRFMDVWRLKVGNDLYPLIRLLLPDVSAKAPALLTTFSETAKGPSTTSRNK